MVQIKKKNPKKEIVQETLVIDDDKITSKQDNINTI